MTSAARHPRARLLPAALVLTVAIVLVALNLRAPIVAVAPVLDQIKGDLALGAFVAGLLTSIPVLCFAVASPLASAVIGRLGAERSVTITLLGIVAATLIRSSGGQAGLLIGTVLLGLSITIGNVVLPVVIRRDFPPERAGLVTGIYTSALNVGSMITSLGTAPVAAATGWPLALVIWISFAVIAGAVWIFAVGFRGALRGSGSAQLGRDSIGTAPIETITGPVRVVTAATARQPATTVDPRPLYRRLSSWCLTLAFAGQSFGYYGMTAWIPTLLHDEAGLSRAGAGASSAVFQICGVVGSLTVPFLALRLRPALIVGLVSLCWTLMPLGLLFAPQLWPLWSVAGGAAQGGGITIMFIIVVRLATSDLEARRLSALMQGCGYALASLGPLIVGVAHDATDGWTASMLIVLCSVLLLAVSGSLASRRLARVGSDPR